MTREEQKQLVREQFAADYNCAVEDFENKETLITVHKQHENARKFENEDSLLTMLSYNGKLVITADEKIIPWCNEVLKKQLSAEWCFDTEALMLIQNKLNEFDYEIEQCHIFFLPEEILAKENAALHWYEREEIKSLESDERIEESFLYDGFIPDMLGTAVLNDKDEVLAVAGASRNGEYMWEIGVDSFTEGKGLGQTVVGNLAKEVMNRGIVPYYGTSISHLASQRVALGAGFRPGFTELRSIKKK